MHVARCCTCQARAMCTLQCAICNVHIANENNEEKIRCTCQSREMCTLHRSKLGARVMLVQCAHCNAVHLFFSSLFSFKAAGQTSGRTRMAIYRCGRDRASLRGPSYGLRWPCFGPREQSVGVGGPMLGPLSVCSGPQLA